MSRPSQIFQILFTQQQYNQLMDQSKALQNQNNDLTLKLQEAHKKLKFFVKIGQQQASLYPQKISHLSKKVLQLSRLLLTYKQKNQQLKDVQSTKKINIIQQQNEMQANKDQILQLQLKLEETQRQLKNLNNLRSAQIQQAKIQRQKNTSKIQLMISQIEDKTKTIFKLEEQLKQRDIIILNQKNLAANFEIQILKREQKLKEKQQIFMNKLHSKEQQLQKLQEIFKRKQIEDAQFLKLKEQSLIAKNLELKTQLEEDYIRQIASLKSFSECECEKEIQQLNIRCNKLLKQKSDIENEKIIYKKKLQKLQKLKTEAEDQLNYLKDWYEDVNNPDHSVLKFYRNYLQIFRQKLLKANEKNIKQQIQVKIKQLLHNIESNLNKYVL